MTRFWFLSFASVSMAIVGTSSVEAKSPPAEVSCASAYGDIWGDGKKSVPKREIEGASIKTPSDFMRMTGTREAGLKIISGGDFSGWDFSNIPLANICFENSKLADANFANVQARGVGFIKADLTGSNMRGTEMPGIFLRNANLSNVAAQDANFSGGHFDGGWFEGGVGGWNIDGADLTGFVFDCGITVPDGCPVYQGEAGISAKGANFTRATLHSFGLHNIDVSGAMLDQTIVAPRQLSNLTTAEFRGDIILRGADHDVRLPAEDARNLIEGTTGQIAADARPSFDCAKAVSKVEREICGEYAHDLRAADRDIAALYQRAKKADPAIVASQRAWLKQRDLCGVAEYPSDCIRGSYSLRKGQLLGLLGENEWLAPGESALFIDDVLPLPANIIQSDLFAKITPTLVGASMAHVVIERRQDGLYAINGDAVGGNAHLCSINGSHLYFDPKSGWYIPISEGAAVPIFRISGNRLEIFADGRPDYETHSEASNFMSCGMRASFGEMIRVDVGEALLKSYRESLSVEM